MSHHTPTQWTYSRENNKIFIHKKGGSISNQQAICWMSHVDISEQAEPNAAFIIRAVNSHEESIKAMKLAFDLIVFGHTHKRTETIEALDQALTKAKDKS